MKTTGKCVKCQGAEVYTNAYQPPRGDRSVMGGADGKLSSNLWINVYACLACGYFEEYIREDVLSNEKAMSKLKFTWRKIG